MREKQKKIIQWSSLALILLTGIIVWRVNYEIDFMMDDEWYSTLLYADTPIRNLGDIVHAQIWHYFNWGGRSMAHALLQLILLAGEHWADILNTGMTLLLGWLACMIADRRKLPYWFAALGMILGLNANWKMSMFWEAGAANYLYMAGFLLAFLFCYLKYEEKNLPGIVIWILPLGLIAGWSNENMGPAVWLLSLLVILLRHREHKKAPVWMYLGNISCLAGTILMIAAPGNFVRSGETGEEAYSLLWRMYLRCYAEAKGVMEYLFPALLLTVFALIVCKGILKENSVVYRDLFDTRIMSMLLPRPGEVIRKFRELYAKSPKEATDYYYKFSGDTDYIRRYRIKRDMKWEAPTGYGDLTITINLSKPEKDPKAIAAAKLMKQAGYPKCLLCRDRSGSYV